MFDNSPLPIHSILPKLKLTLTHFNTVILQAPPGAGKSTLLPISLLEEPWLGTQKILMLEPRRLAAKAVANRMSDLINETCGKRVGYKVRFENKISANTQLEVVTEGILTRMMQEDNALEKVGMVIFDEFHERSLQADLALALCLQVQQVLRPDLRILIMSATLDSNRLQKLLPEAPLLSCDGRQFPVNVVYQPASDEFRIHQSMANAVQQALKKYEGDILCFLPGSGEIQRTAEILEASVFGTRILKLYGDLPITEQQDAILPDAKGLRKVVLSTSIAETSLTIEGIKVVIDSGLSRVPRFDLQSGMTRLSTVKVTKDSAEQRSGRAGRLSSGTCIRLWNESVHQHLLPHRIPEMLEADLSTLLLETYKWGVKDVNELKWVDKPNGSSVNYAKEILTGIKAIENNSITEHGKKILTLPTHPRLAHALIVTKEQQTTDGKLLSLACDVAALLEERDPLSREAEADLGLRVELLRKMRRGERINSNKNAFQRVERIANSWRSQLKAHCDNDNPSEHDIGYLIALAYPERMARRLDKNSNRYRLAGGKIASLKEVDPLQREEWLAIAHMDAGTNEGKIFLAAPLDIETMKHLATSKNTLTWDSTKGIIVANTEWRIGSMIVESKPIKEIDITEKNKVICEAIKINGVKMIPGLLEIQDLQTRVHNAKSWDNSSDWPDLSTENLMLTCAEWLSLYLDKVFKQNELDKLNMLEIVTNILTWEQQERLNKIAPTHLKVPSGSLIKVEYFTDTREPEISVRLQELFGLAETPAVNEGNVKVKIALLSPGYKPVQVTRDLKSFWENTYPEVRKQLKIRYPRHSWPEDPWTAEAVRGAKKRGS